MNASFLQFYIELLNRWCRQLQTSTSLPIRTVWSGRSSQQPPGAPRYMAAVSGSTTCPSLSHIRPLRERTCFHQAACTSPDAFRHIPSAGASRTQGIRTLSRVKTSQISVVFIPAAIISKTLTTTAEDTGLISRCCLSAGSL